MVARASLLTLCLLGAVVQANASQPPVCGECRQASIRAHGDNVLVFEHIVDGEVEEREEERKWETPFVKDVQFHPSSKFVFEITDAGVVGGFIAEIDLCGEVYLTSSEISTEPVYRGFSIVESASAFSGNLVVTDIGSGAWGNRVSSPPFSPDVKWVWDDQIRNTITFQFDLSCVETPPPTNAPTIPPGTAQVFVFEDRNSNGRSEKNEQKDGVQGVHVGVIHTDGSVFAGFTPVPTDADGLATLPVPAEGDFKLAFTLDAFPGSIFTKPNIGPDSTDSDVDPETGWTTQTFNLGGDSSRSLKVQAGVLLPGSLVVTTFADLNGNSVLENAEPGVSGVEVVVVDSSGLAPLIHPLTNEPLHGVAGEDGQVVFDWIPIEVPFRVKFNITALGDHAFAQHPNRGNDQRDSDVDPATGLTSQTYKITKSSEKVLSVHAGILTPGRIQVAVFDDVNGNNVRDNSERENPPDLSGVIVTVLEENGQDPIRFPHSNLLVQATTDRDGRATLYAPANRPFKVNFNISRLVGHKFAMPNRGNDKSDSDVNPDTGTTAQRFVVSRAEETFSDIFAGVLCPGTAVFRVWDDLNGDGSQNADEASANIQGIKVLLLEDDHTPVKHPFSNLPISSVTNEDGRAYFDWIPADRSFRFLVENSVPGSQFTHPGRGNDAVDSDVDKVSGITQQAFTATKGSQAFDHLAAGLFTPGTLTVQAWDDVNGDGFRNGNEAELGVSGVNVTILEEDQTLLLHPDTGKPIFVITDETGIAHFSWVPADRPFRLKFGIDRLPGTRFTHANRGNDGGDSDAGLEKGITSQTYTASKGSQAFDGIDVGVWMPGSLLVKAWDDRNGDGYQNDNEDFPIQGIVATLLEDDQSPITHPETGEPIVATTNENGTALLSWVPADRPFRVKFDASALPGVRLTHLNRGNDAGDSDADSESGVTTQKYEASKGSQAFDGIDVGVWMPGSLLVKAWDDRNGDGYQNDNEDFPIQGVVATLLEDDQSPIMHPETGEPIVAATNENGTALLSWVPANRPVRVKFDASALPGARLTHSNRGNDAGDSDADSESGVTTQKYEASKGSQAFDGIDVGVWMPGSLSVKAWDDRNGDGYQNDNEDFPIQGVVATLLEDDQSPITHPETGESIVSVTNENGTALLSWVPADRPFRVKFDASALPGVRLTHSNRGNDAGDSDADHATGITTQKYEASKGSQAFDGIDVGLWSPGSILVKAWDDRNGDGYRNTNEDFPVQGVVATLLEDDLSPILYPETGEPVVATTNEDGTALLFWAPADRPFRVKFNASALPGVRLTHTNRGNDAGDSDADRETGITTQKYEASKGAQSFDGIDVGLFSPGTLLARVWDDWNGNGVQDRSEALANVSDVIVTLYDATAGTAILHPETGVPVQAVSDSHGRAFLSWIPADRKFRLHFNISAHPWTRFTHMNRGNDASDSDAHPDTGFTTQVYESVKGAQTFSGSDAGIWSTGSLEARAWFDRNKNGRQDINENSFNIAGVRVTLVSESSDTPLVYPGTNLVVEAETNENGIAYLAPVPADTKFRVKFDPRDPTFSFTRAKYGNDVGDSDAHNANGITLQKFSPSTGRALYSNVAAGFSDISQEAWDAIFGPPPSTSPSSSPTLETDSPTISPSRKPTSEPTQYPTFEPTKSPSKAPTGSPSQKPTANPTKSPSDAPTQFPTLFPTTSPSFSPSVTPSNSPSTSPTSSPSSSPTEFPSASPTDMPTDVPTVSPSESPSASPTDVPTVSPSKSPSASPTDVPTVSPSKSPSASPTDVPTVSPSKSPSASPTDMPTVSPSKSPSASPTDVPTVSPSKSPSASPTDMPTVSPSKSPSASPTDVPTVSPSKSPSASPTESPTDFNVIVVPGRPEGSTRIPTTSPVVTGSPVTSCEGGPVDVVFVVDASTSRFGYWDNAKTFIQGLSDELGVGPGHSHVGLVGFSESIEVEVNPNTENGQSPELFNDQVNQWTPSRNSRTSLGAALIKAKSFFEGIGEGRRRYVVLLLDSKPNRNHECSENGYSRNAYRCSESAMLDLQDEKNAQVVLLYTRKSRTNVFRKKESLQISVNFNNLEPVMDRLADMICPPTPSPTQVPSVAPTKSPQPESGSRPGDGELPTLAPTTFPPVATSPPVVSCNGAPMDILFLLDSSTAEKSSWINLKTFVRDIVDAFDLGPNQSRLGLLAFNTGIELEIDFDDEEAQSHKRFKYKLDNWAPVGGRLVKSGLPLALIEAGKMFNNNPIDQESRPGAKRVIVAIMDSRPTSALGCKEQGYHRNARRCSQQAFFALPDQETIDVVYVRTGGGWRNLFKRREKKQYKMNYRRASNIADAVVRAICD